MNWENPVKKLLRDGEPVIGITITVPSIEIAAQAANLGFDFLWIEMEHSPITLETLRGMVLATRGLKAVPFARVPVADLWTAKRVLDQGVLGVMFPFCSTPQLAARAADATHYPPKGKRGSGAGLATFRWPAPEGYYDFADENILTICVIEEEAAINHIDEIAATPGVDVLFIGTSDLSFSMGFRGEQGHPRHEEAIAQVVAAGKKHGKYLGRPAMNTAAIERGRSQGFQFFQAATDTGFLAAGARQILDPLGKKGIESKTTTFY